MPVVLLSRWKFAWTVLAAAACGSFHGMAQAPNRNDGEKKVAAVVAVWQFQAVLHALNSSQASADQRVQMLNLEASACHDRGEYREAERLYREALHLLDPADSSQLLERLRLLNNLGNLKCETADHRESESLLGDALALATVTAGADSAMMATCWNNLARLRLEQGRLAEAGQLYGRARELLEQRFGPKHPHLLASRNNLAALYREQGKLAEAESLQKEVVEEMILARGRDHPFVAGCLVNLGKVFLAQGRSAEAERACREAWTIYETTVGLDSRTGVSCVELLGRVLAGQGKLGEAESLYLRALATRDHQTGVMHPATADLLAALAEISLQREDYAKADELCRAAIDIYDIKCGSAGQRKLPDVLRNAASAARGLQQTDRASSMEARLRTVEANLGRRQ